MIPPLDSRGLLPAGYHSGSLSEIEFLFCTNHLREHRFAELRRFIKNELIPVAAGLELYACGSFISDKAAPGDIDCAVIIPANEFPNRMPLLTLLDDGRGQDNGAGGRTKGRIWDQYGVEIFASITAPGYLNFLEFFSYVGLKSATAKGLDVKDRRGIVRIESWITG